MRISVHFDKRRNNRRKQEELVRNFKGKTNLKLIGKWNDELGFN